MISDLSGMAGEDGPLDVLMHLLVLGAFCPLPLGTASLRHFRGLERHRLRKHPAGLAGAAPYLTTFRHPDAKRHRRHLEHLQPPTSNDVKPKDRRSRP